jgi:hypothetical protein
LRRGLTAIRLVTPLTPHRLRTSLSASCFWNCHSTSPSSGPIES